MVGLVVVSHIEKLAEGVVELVRLMAANAPIAAAGGLEDGTPGTSFGKIASAVERVNSGSGVAILMDMGSAVMTAEMVLESVNDPQIRLIDCPIAEGAVVAAMESVAGNSLDDIVAATGNWSAYKKF